MSGGSIQQPRRLLPSEGGLRVSIRVMLEATKSQSLLLHCNQVLRTWMIIFALPIIPKLTVNQTDLTKMISNTGGLLGSQFPKNSSNRRSLSEWHQSQVPGKKKKTLRKGRVTQPLGILVIKGECMWNKWEMLRSSREIFTDVSQNNHVKTMQRTNNSK